MGLLWSPDLQNEAKREELNMNECSRCIVLRAAYQYL